MAYKALYRKYRPISFDDIVGQDSIIKVLKGIINQKKISHAYLFMGTRGTGKTSVARLFAKYVNCPNLTNGEICNVCPICEGINTEKNPDVIEIDAASNNKVDEIRELKSKINLSPSISKYKVYIIDEVHMLSPGAFNALLKTLEEPPAHIIFILATTEIQKLPLTIISRCLTFNFKKITEKKIIEKLNEIIINEKILITKEALVEIARLSDGGMRDAIGLLEQSSFFSSKEIKKEDIYLISGTISTMEIFVLLKSIISVDLKSIFKQIEDFDDKGKDFVKITEKLIFLLRNLLIYSKNKKIIEKEWKEDLEIYEKLVDSFSEKVIYNFIINIMEDLEIMKKSLQQKVIFELMLLKMVDEKTEKFLKEDIQSEIQIKKEIKREEKLKGLENGINLEYKKILINNILAKAKRKYLNEALKNWEQLKNYMFNNEYKKIIVSLLDTKVVAACNDRLIITCVYSSTLKKIELGIEEVEEVVSKIFNKKILLIPLQEKEWFELRSYYVNMKEQNQKIELKEEKEVLELMQKQRNKQKGDVSKETQKAIEMFGENFIEMKG
ncbi:MAG: DNA polymerase III subunit gamma/tau [Bacilli bacterium]|jgi:DNA polymerase-3 subunit gamma/tau